MVETDETPDGSPLRNTAEAGHVLHLGGPFRLIGPEGPIVIPSAKGRAIVALVACAPDRLRTRAWLAECLWGLSDNCHALASLRSELLRLRPLVGGATGLLRITRDVVALRPGAVRIERRGELLEGLRVLGAPGFDAWLRVARSAAGATIVGYARPDQDTYRPRDGGAALRMCFVPAPRPVPAEAAMQARLDAMLTLIGHALREIGGIEILELRGATGDVGPNTVPDIYLQSSITGPGVFTLEAIRSSDRRIVWSQPCRLDGPEMATAEDLTERLLAHLSINPRAFGNGRHLAVVRALTGVEHMFSLSPENFARADTCLTDAIEMYDGSSFHAWRAYLSTFWMEERETVPLDDLTEMVRTESDAAMRLDPTNGLSLSLLAHVHAFVLRDFEKAGDLIERARALRSNHVMTHDAEALFKLYNDDPMGARQHAMKAAMLGRFLSYRYAFVTTLSMIAAMTGAYEAGIRHGRLALSLQPRAAAQPYAPTLRYLGTCLSQAGRVPEARTIFARLAAIEPNLSAQLVGTPDYPVPSPTASVLIRGSLARAGY